MTDPAVADSRLARGPYDTTGIKKPGAPQPVQKWNPVPRSINKSHADLSFYFFFFGAGILYCVYTHPFSCFKFDGN